MKRLNYFSNKFIFDIYVNFRPKKVKDMKHKQTSSFNMSEALECGSNSSSVNCTIAPLTEMFDCGVELKEEDWKEILDYR